MRIFSFFFPSFAFCATLVWDSVVQIPVSRHGTRAITRFSSSGLGHFFWRNCTNAVNELIYQTFLPNGTLTHKKIMSVANDTNHFNNIAMQVSDDGKHLLVTYDTTRDPLKYFWEVLFIESMDGGEHWSEPVKVLRENMEDNVHRVNSSLLLEKDTGKVYIAYNHIDNNTNEQILAISVREPGKKTFEQEVLYPKISKFYSATLGYTVDRASGTRYLHMFRYTKFTELYYRQSMDGGKTWGNDIYIARNMLVRSPPPIGIDTRIIEPGYYIQFGTAGDFEPLQITWSKDHGLTREKPILAGDGFITKNSMGMCGRNGKGILISTTMVFSHTDSRVAFVRLGENKYQDLTFPVKKLFERDFSYPEISCGYIKENRYAVMLIIEDIKKGILYATHGILEDE